MASGIVVSHFGSEFNQTTTNKRSLPLLLSQAHVEWTIRRTDLGATLAGQHSKLKVIRVYVLSFLNVRVYFLSSLSSHVQVLSFLSFLNFLRPKVTDHDHSRSPHGHWRWYGHSAIFLQDMHIVVKQVSTNDTTIVCVEAYDTIAAVKAKIQDTVGHPVYQQRLGLDPKDELWTSWGERRLIWGGGQSCRTSVLSRTTTFKKGPCFICLFASSRSEWVCGHRTSFILIILVLFKCSIAFKCCRSNVIVQLGIFCGRSTV